MIKEEYKKRPIKHKKTNPYKAGAGWEIVYSGFILILLSFFVMLSSFTTIEQGNVFRFVRSFVSSVSILEGGVKFEKGKEVVADSVDMVDKDSELASVCENLKEAIKKLGLEKKIGFSFSKEGLVMRLPDVVLFDVGAAELSPKALPLLRKIAAIISSIPNFIRIESHTDNVPIHTEKFPSNWELSAARAVNELRYFTEEEKILAKRFSVVGYGQYHPIFPNDTPEHRAKNRRVGIVFTR